VGLGRPRDIEFHLTQELVIGIDEGHVDFKGLADAGSGEMFFAARTVGFVGKLLADLGEMVLTVGMLDVGQKFRSFPSPVTAAAQEIPGGPHLGGIDIGLRQHPAAP